MSNVRLAWNCLWAAAFAASLTAGCYSESLEQRLARVPPEQRMDCVLAQLHALGAWDRMSAADALGRMGDRRAVEPLIAALNDCGRYVAPQAAGALGALGDRRAVEPLIAKLSDAEVRGAAAGALGELGDPRAVEPLLKLLPQEQYPYTIIEALGRLGDRRAVAVILPFLTHDRGSIRQTAAVALGRLGDPAAIPALVTALDLGDWTELSDPRFRYYATPSIVEALGELRAVPALVAVLQHSQPIVRENAARTLGQLGDAAAVEPLVQLAREEADVFTRAAAIEALARLHDPRATAAVAAARSDPNPLVLNAAERALRSATAPSP